jgi:hypothetical protein
VGGHICGYFKIKSLHLVPDIEGQHIGNELVLLQKDPGLVGSPVFEAGLRRSLQFVLFRNAYM